MTKVTIPFPAVLNVNVNRYFIHVPVKNLNNFKSRWHVAKSIVFERGNLVMGKAGSGKEEKRFFRQTSDFADAALFIYRGYRPVSNTGTVGGGGPEHERNKNVYYRCGRVWRTDPGYQAVTACQRYFNVR